MGEYKFTNAPLDYRSLASLEGPAAEVRWMPDAGERDITYALFPRSGATRSMQEAVSERDDVRLFDLGEITENV